MKIFAVIILIFVPNLRNERSVGRFDGVQFVILNDRVAVANRHKPPNLPSLPVVLRDAGADSLFVRPKLFPDVKERSVGELAGAVRAVERRRIARRPSDPAVGRALHPTAEFLLAGVGVDSVVDALPSGEPGVAPLPFPLGASGDFGVQPRFVSERSEGRNENRPFVGNANSGVAVVDRAVVNRLRPSPSFAAVLRSNQIDATERADVRFAPAGSDDKQLVPAKRDGRPTVIDSVFRRQRRNFRDLELRRRARPERQAAQIGRGDRSGQQRAGRLR